MGNITNPGADLDPEAPGYPNSSTIKKAKHELVVAGYSAGALCGRMALLLMEFEHEKNKCDLLSVNKTNSTVHRVKTWIGIDHEAQGSNTPIGLQMFWDFEESLNIFPSNIADIFNSIVASTAKGLINTPGIARQNTLYHHQNMFSVGSDSWNVGHHQDFDNYYSDLEAITPSNYPSNLSGYPKNCYRIAVSQGNANGIKQLLSYNTNLLSNQSPATWCSSYLQISSSAISYYRKATARVLTNWNNDAFDCNFGVNFHFLFYNLHVNLGHWKYHNQNKVIDRYVGNWQNYDECPASTLPSHRITAKAMALSSENNTTNALTFCNSKEVNIHLHGFAPTVSGLDLHLPGNNNLPRLPNLSLVPGNISGGMQLMQQNKYNLGNNNSPNNDFGYPYLTFPTNHYDYSPYDAIWANTRNDINYDDNTIHVEDPNPNISEFLVEEIAPYNLYLSNRTIVGESYNCGAQHIDEKYYADFEARNGLLLGNQSIYEHLTYSGLKNDRQRTSAGDFIIDNNAVVTLRANNQDGQSGVVLGAGFSAKAGSIVRAYVYGNSYCHPFSYRLANTTTGQPTPELVLSRPITSKRLHAQKLSNSTKPLSIALYPNPTQGSINYAIQRGESYHYTLADITGKILLTGNLQQELSTINLQTFDKGVYIITVSNTDYIQTDRIILQ